MTETIDGGQTGFYTQDMTTTMQIIINGARREVPAGMTVQGLLEEMGVRGPVAVEVNKELCPKRAHEERKLGEGDEVEIVTIVGGG